MTKIKCFVCKKKLSLVEETAGLCKCDNVFCVKHKLVGTDPNKNRVISAHSIILSNTKNY